MHKSICGRRKRQQIDLVQSELEAHQRNYKWRIKMPEDPNILLSYVNLKLRDFYSGLDAMCEDMGVSKTEIEEKLGSIGCRYNAERNRFE